MSNDESIRVLSYNFGAHPWGFGGYQQERINTLVSLVDSFDVVLLQEVYPNCVLPYAVQQLMCPQRQILDKLHKKGFHHYVLSRQPSYKAMASRRIMTSSGLVIASKFPIYRHGSHTFRASREDKYLTHGCLFAEIQTDRSDTSATAIFFNVHLKPNSKFSFQMPYSHVQETKQFVTSVMNHVSRSDRRDSWLPFMIAGDFNISGADTRAAQPSAEFRALLAEFDVLHDMHNVLFDPASTTLGSHSSPSIPPSRSPQGFFDTSSTLGSGVSRTGDPWRQDFFFVSRQIEVIEERLEKFVVDRRPYVYLSDHFGFAVTLRVPLPDAEDKTLVSSRKPLRLSITAHMDEAVTEDTPYVRNMCFFALCTAVVVAASLRFSWKFFVMSVAAFLGMMNVIKKTFLKPIVVSSPAPVPSLQDGVPSAALPSLPHPGYRLHHKVDPDLVCHRSSLQGLWASAVRSYAARPCLLFRDHLLRYTSLSFATVDEKAKKIGRGLLAFGLKPGDKLGMYCDPCENAIVMDIVSLLFGFCTVSLIGRGSVVRAVLDHNDIRTVCATPGSLHTLLTSRSTNLEQIICLDGFAAESEVAVAKDLNIQIFSISSIRNKAQATQPFSSYVVSPTSIWTYVLDDIATSNFTELRAVTHQDVLRDLKVLQDGVILPPSDLLCAPPDRIVWYAPFAYLFPRVCTLGVLFSGGSVAAADPVFLEEACRQVRPTVFISPPSLIQHSLSSLLLSSRKKYFGAYRWVLRNAYSLCSFLIHTKRMDSPPLRYLFFDDIHQQFGGLVRRFIFYTSLESVPFHLLEFAAVCCSPVVKEVVYLNCGGVCALDGEPVHDVQIQLGPIDEMSSAAALGRLVVQRTGSDATAMDIAARYDHRQLTLLDSVHGILWPVGYQYAVAVVLERTFSLSRYVSNVFVFCHPLQSLTAVVYPNRDTVEFAWRQATGADADHHLGWKELVSFGADLILNDLVTVGREHQIHDSQLPKFIHLHPHAFRDHAPFLNPFGKPCREKMIAYFEHFFTKIYSPLSPKDSGVASDFPSDTEASVDSDVNGDGNLCVPFTMDIGGTFAKIAYVMPPGLSAVQTPSFLQHEPSSLSHTLGIRVFHFFRDKTMAESELQEVPASSVGTVRFMKVPTSQISALAEFVRNHEVLKIYQTQFQKSIRATGGGAFKYAHVAQDRVGARFDVVKEMDAVVQGLNLVLRIAPSSIFTVNPDSGEILPHRLYSAGSNASPFPYLLINIGSGISFIKCTGSDGSHVRVGGSPVGGATFWGLTRALTHLTSWEEVLEIMRLDGPGDNKNVDLLVGDIYGFNAKDLPAMLSSETVASCFGKYNADFFTRDKGSPTRSPETGTPSSSFAEVNGEFNARLGLLEKPSSIDMVRSLLNMLSGNVTQLAFLHSKLHGIKNIFFVGGFVRENHMLWSLISRYLSYWSSGEFTAHFLQHDGYLGALGCTVFHEAAAERASEPGKS